METVGDCYVAVTGLPDPRRDHAAGKSCIVPFVQLIKHRSIKLTRYSFPPFLVRRVPRSITAMCRFAKEAYWKMKEVVRKLEPELGPGTADLTMRMGIHSGPVTGGVLRGGRSRFQLFG